MAAATTYEIGTTLGGMVTLASLDIPVPESDFTDFSDSVKLGSGLTRGLGYPLVTWHYGFLYLAQWDALIFDFCPTASASIFIATPNNSQTFLRYTAVMVPPPKYIIRNAKYIDVTVSFNNLIAAE